MIPLFGGSLMPTPKAYVHFHESITAQRERLREALLACSSGSDLTAAHPQTVSAVSAALSVPESPVSDEPDALRGDCALLMIGALAILEDPTVRHPDPHAADRLRALADRREA